MLGWFKSPPFHDPQLGTLTRKAGCWRGAITFASDSAACVPLTLCGTRTEPDVEALSAARTLIVDFETLRSTVAEALFGHYGPYADEADTDELPVALRIDGPSDVWPHVSLVFVSVVPLEGRLTTEFGYRATWDDEHTLGVRFRSGTFLKLCGSVLDP